MYAIKKRNKMSQGRRDIVSNIFQIYNKKTLILAGYYWDQLKSYSVRQFLFRVCLCDK